MYYLSHSVVAGKSKSGDESDGEEGVGVKRSKKAVLSDSEDDEIVPRKKKRAGSRESSGSEQSESESDGEGGRRKKKKKRITKAMSDSEDEVRAPIMSIEMIYASVMLLIH